YRVEELQHHRYTLYPYTTLFRSAFTENVFKHIKDPELEEFDDSLKMKTSWGQRYDIEQLMEHAIVHVLRHKRQLERIKRDILNRSEEHTSELQSRENLVCRLLLE